MSNIALLHYKLRARIHEFDSNVATGFAPAALDVVLRAAIRNWLMAVTSSSFELNSTVMHKVSGLVVRSVDAPTSLQKPLAPAFVTPDGIEYVFDFDKLAFPFWQYVSSTVELRKGKCRRKGNVVIVQHDDLRYLLQSPNDKPSWDYEEVLGVEHRKDSQSTITSPISENRSLRVFTDGTFVIRRLFLNYIKTPNEVCLGGYIDVNGNPTTTVECDISPNYYDEIIEFADLEVKKNYGYTKNFNA